MKERTGAVALAGAALASAAAGPAAALAFAALAVFLLGLPHGAGDLLRVRRSERVEFVAAYLATAACVLILWRLSPAAALAGFLLLSMLHFADDAPAGEAVVAALVPVAGPAVLHGGVLAGLFGSIGVGEGAAHLLATGLTGAGLVEAGSALLVAATRADRRGPLLLGTSAAVSLPPLPGFATAFVVLHAWPQTKRLADEAGMDAGACLRAVLPVMAGAAGVCVAAAIWLHDRPAPHLAALFGAISALATPHMLVTPFWARRGTLAFA